MKKKKTCKVIQDVKEKYNKDLIFFTQQNFICIKVKPFDCILLDLNIFILDNSSQLSQLLYIIKKSDKLFIRLN